MKPNVRLAIVVVIALMIAIALWLLISAQSKSPHAPGFPNAVHSAVSESMNFVKSHVTGGVGAAVSMENGLPVINSVLPGSPAESAGLRPGDYIIAVGNWPTTNQPLVKVVETIRGVTGGKVTLTVQRAGTTNLTLTLHRSSWKTLGVPIAPTTPIRNGTNIVILPGGGFTNGGRFIPSVPSGTNVGPPPP